jgi:hypothetical protein
MKFINNYDEICICINTNDWSIISGIYILYISMLLICRIFLEILHYENYNIFSSLQKIMNIVIIFNISVPLILLCYIYYF